MSVHEKKEKEEEGKTTTPASDPDKTLSELGIEIPQSTKGIHKNPPASTTYNGERLNHVCLRSKIRKE